MSRGGWGGKVQLIQGRGRGRGSGFGLALDTQSTVTYNEIPLYPPMTIPPIRPPIAQEEILFEISESLIQAMKESPYYIEPEVEKVEFKRYADRYLQQSQKASLVDHLILLEPDMSLFPPELNLLSTKYTPKKSSRSFGLDRIDALEKMGGI